MSTLTNAEVRFEAALNGVQARGVHVALNVMTCCRSCATWIDFGLESAEARREQPYAWTFGGQGAELVWRNGQAYYRAEAQEDGDEDEDGFYGSRAHQKRAENEAYEVFFQHGGPDLVAAQTLTEVFRGEGFEVEWDGTDAHAVIVHLS
jgi:hypothetical protein